MIITFVGFIFSTMLFIISDVSIPVFPITFGINDDTLLYPSSTSPNRNKCLVTNMLFTVRGPRESGVLLSFPKPITINLSSFFKFKYFFNSFIK